MQAGTSISLFSLDCFMEVDVSTVKRWLDRGLDDSGVPVCLVDCREPAEYQTASIHGATLVPMSQWPPSQELIDSWQGKHMVVHCHHGGRSLRVANWFRQNGFPDALSMAGGIDQWSLEIDPRIPQY